MKVRAPVPSDCSGAGYPHMARPPSRLVILVAALAAAAAAVGSAAAAAAPPPAGTRTLTTGGGNLLTPGRAACGNSRGYWSVKPCGGSYPNTIDAYFVDDGSGRQRWKLAPHSSGVGASIQVGACRCSIFPASLPLGHTSKRICILVNHPRPPTHPTCSLSAVPHKTPPAPRSSPHPMCAPTLR